MSARVVLRLRALVLLVVAASFALGAARATASRSDSAPEATAAASVPCVLKPLRFGAYACHYYGFISGVHRERWNIDFDGVILEPRRGCPRESQHASGGVDVSYRSLPVAHPRRAKVTVLWERRRGGALRPGSIGSRYIAFTVALRRFATGTERYTVPPPAICAEEPKQLNTSSCGQRTRSVRGTVESHYLNRRNDGANVLTPSLELVDLHDCPDVTGWALGTAGHAKFARNVLLRRAKFTLRGRARQTTPVRTYGKTIGRIVMTGIWTATFCQTGRVKPADCRT